MYHQISGFLQLCPLLLQESWIRGFEKVMILLPVGVHYQEYDVVMVWDIRKDGYN